mmetsp:Transcript_10607/g.25818  ORF Transcript_10607/g.25818 Transcript_10607/m.25818 type:complete len:108 (-) Transcript_10607:41-364(-)
MLAPMTPAPQMTTFPGFFTSMVTGTEKALAREEQISTGNRRLRNRPRCTGSAIQGLPVKRTSPTERKSGLIQCSVCLSVFVCKGSVVLEESERIGSSPYWGGGKLRG